VFAIDTRSRVPIYEQLGQNILSLVASGALAPDDQLPSVRNLARELGINPNTVQRAYQELESQGIIYQAAGRGSFVAPSQHLTGALVRRRLEALRTPVLDARRAGAKKEQVVGLVEELYEGERAK
jgi:GntR family transcriptional regulator